MLEIENLPILFIKIIDQTNSAKVVGQEGNSPDYLLKFVNIEKYKNLKT